MKRIFTLCAIFSISSMAFAQYEISSFTSTGRGGATSFVTDYQAVGINPANLGWESEFEDKKITMGFSEMSFSFHSEALSKEELRQEIKNSIQGKTVTNWTQQQKREAGRDFANSGLALNFDMGAFGFSFASEKFGGIAFRMNDNMNLYSRLGDNASELVFMGRQSNYFDSLVYVNPDTFDTTVIANYDMEDADSLQNVLRGFANVPKMIGELINGSRISASWTREYNLSYGRKVFGKDDVIEIYAGAGVKYIQGFAMVDVRSENNTLSAFSAITPFFDIDYGSATAINPSSTSQSGTLPNSVGRGFGADFGLNFLIKSKLKVGFALTNVGSMTWTGNVYTMRDTLVFDTESEGLNNYNVLQTLTDLSGDEGLFVWDGKKEIKTQLPTLFRMGSSIAIGKIAQLGVDVLLPVEKEAPTILEGAIIGFGGDIRPIPWIRFSAGFVTGGNYDFSIPLGVTFIAGNGSWEGGIASRDAVTFFTQNGPTLSFSTGFLRFRF